MTRYEKGFIEKCAEYGVDGRAVLDHMQKQALSASRLARISAKLHPSVNPDKLNWFTRLFTTTKNTPIVVRGSDKVNGIAKAISNAAPYGTTGVDETISTAARGMRSKTRLSPGRILAALGLAGGAGALGGTAAASAAGGAAPAVGSGKILAALLGAGAAGTAAAAASKKKKDKDDSENDDGKSGKKAKKPSK